MLYISQTEADHSKINRILAIHCDNLIKQAHIQSGYSQYHKLMTEIQSLKYITSVLFKDNKKSNQNKIEILNEFISLTDEFINNIKNDRNEFIINDKHVNLLRRITELKNKLATIPYKGIK